jgi:hypothetical protein
MARGHSAVEYTSRVASTKIKRPNVGWALADLAATFCFVLSRDILHCHWVARALSFADCHLVAGPSVPSYTAAMKWGFTKRQGITILVIATVALIVLMILVFRATSAP